MSNSRQIKITLTFEANDLQRILDAANFGEEGALQLDELTGKQFKELKQELVSTAPNFVEEIVDGSYDACANDWLEDFRGDEDDEDDE